MNIYPIHSHDYPQRENAHLPHLPSLHFTAWCSNNAHRRLHPSPKHMPQTRPGYPVPFPVQIPTRTLRVSGFRSLLRWKPQHSAYAAFCANLHSEANRIRAPTAPSIRPEELPSPNSSGSGSIRLPLQFRRWLRIRLCPLQLFFSGSRLQWSDPVPEWFELHMLRRKWWCFHGFVFSNVLHEIWQRFIGSKGCILWKWSPSELVYTGVWSLWSERERMCIGKCYCWKSNNVCPQRYRTPK